MVLKENKFDTKMSADGKRFFQQKHINRKTTFSNQTDQFLIKALNF